jgi:hypothetical protein
MGMTPQEMDRKVDQHFGFEARDDVDGVLATLAPDGARHCRMAAWTDAWPGRRAAVLRALFADLSDGKVSAEAGFMATISWSTSRSGAAERQETFRACRQNRPLEFRLARHRIRQNGDIKRENVWVDLAAIMQQLPQV